MEPAIILGIISLSVSILIGLWNIKINIENHKMKKIEFQREQNKYYKEMFDIRPKFEIISSKNLRKYDANEDAELDCLVVPIKNYMEVEGHPEFTYEKKVLEKKDWMSLSFEIKNVGKSEISYFYIAWNSPKNTSLFEVNNESYVFFIENKLLNYRAMFEKSVKNNGILNLRINFHKDFIMYGSISAEATLWMVDEYNKVWRQPLFVHKKELYDSSLATHKEMKNFTDIDDAIRCFKNPYLW